METALYCVRAKVAQTCRCCRGRQAETGTLGQAQSSSALWRPWVTTARDTEKHRRSSFGSVPDGSGSRQSLGFKHPVRLKRNQTMDSETQVKSSENNLQKIFCNNGHQVNF
ncbi:protein ripply3 isoform X2 [Pristis pectinata]|uniref:protein ripply3 isoform X2 n=1 Tax=Pristis pectinata TaxID=685728 RepID=UPI00223CAD17|nr:protein ripply3 isoform X2 [Pristis pectinata]